MAKLTTNGTTSSERTGIATLIRFRMERDSAAVGLMRENGQRVILSCEPDLARKLLAEFGYKKTATFISVEPLIGMKVRYRESATGMLLEAHPLKN